MNEKDPVAASKSGNSDSPRIFRIAEFPGTEPSTRRQFLSGMLKVVGAATVLSHLTACEEEKHEIAVDGLGRCTCHVVGQDQCRCESVCTCEQVSACICNMVCTCNTVGTVVRENIQNCPSYCSCVGHCSCDGQGGHSLVYWYPC